MQGRGHAWTDAEREVVAGLLQAHLSYRRIAELMGVTRNAVIGRVLRDDELHAKYSAPPPPRKAKRPPRWSSPKSRHWTRHLEPFDCAEVEPLEPMAGELKPLAALAHGECRWPMQFADVIGRHLFCGRRTAGDHTQYCPYHHKEAHQC